METISILVIIVKLVRLDMKGLLVTHANQGTFYLGAFAFNVNQNVELVLQRIPVIHAKIVTLLLIVVAADVISHILTVPQRINALPATRTV
jgi:hypothetical protein